MKTIKIDSLVSIAERYLSDEVGLQAAATPTAIVISKPTDSEELVGVQYTNGNIDYIPQDVIEELSKPIIYYSNGEQVNVQPKRKHFSLKELQEIVGGSIELVSIDSETTMIINEEGKLDNLPYNIIATNVAKKALFKNDYICGNALVCSPKLIK